MIQKSIIDNKNTSMPIFSKDIVKALRTGDYGNASAGLNEILQLLQEELRKRNIEPNGLQKLIISLQTLYSMQKMGDWIAVADILEYELIKLWAELNK